METSASLGPLLKTIRESQMITPQAVQEATGIDISLLSRIENGKRLPNQKHIQLLAALYDCDERLLMVQRESDQLVKSMAYYPDIAYDTLKAAEDKVRYGTKYISLFQDQLFRKPVSLESRRYIGSKAKLCDWIFSVILNECPETHSFCDLFAGTASVANRAIPYYDKVLINDFLYSNNAVYQGFFGRGEWDKEKLSKIIGQYNELNPDKLEDNYFSENFGDTYFSRPIAKQIGYIRQDIEDRKEDLTQKEYYVLIASLIYSMDKIANTVGHYDAYLKKAIEPKTLTIRMIDAHSMENVELYQRNANELVREISPDIVYIDPPYNSRQYGSAYHLLENVTLWKKPPVTGVARKPTMPLSKSSYCTNHATEAFQDLVDGISAKYIVVSYNNMAKKGNGRSNAKIDDKDLTGILSAKGEVQVYSHAHKAFTTGKSNINDNLERLFICKVKSNGVEN